jgi:polar amino acid transport system substrate-binding protein
MKNHKIIIIVPIILTVFFTNVFPVFAKPSLTITTATFPPFKFQKGEGIVGIDTEIILAVFDRMGYDVKIRMITFRRADEDTRKGKYPAYYGFTYSDDRGKDYLYTSPISAIQEGFFYDTSRLDESKIQRIRDWETMDFLRGLSIGVAAGYNYHSDFMKMWRPAGKTEWKPNENGFVRIFSAQEITSMDTEKQNLKKLAHGRMDAFISEISVGMYHRNQNLEEFGKITHAKQLIGTVRTLHMGFSKKWKGANGETPLGLRDHFNFELAKFIQEGGRLPIFKKYGFVSPFIPKTNVLK